MSLAAGKLRHQVQIQQPVTVIDSNGERTETWEHVAYVWAAVEPLSAKEFMTAQQIQSKVSTRITIRYRDSIDATMRIVFRGKLFNIEGVLSDPVSGLEYLTLPCSQGLVSDDEPPTENGGALTFNGDDLTYNGEGVTYNYGN